MRSLPASRETRERIPASRPPTIRGVKTMQRTKPPFRADHVGSLLRTPALKAAREKRARGEIAAEGLKAIEDREVDGVIAKQEAAGLQSITDGEYRRISWNYRFPRTARQRRILCRRTQDQVSTQRPAAAAGPAAPHRQARRLQAASDDRAFQVPAARTPSARRK